MSGITGTAGGAARLANQEGAGEGVRRERVAVAAREFEAMFLLQMLKQMRQSLLAEETDEPGLGAAAMTDTIDGELARHLAGRSGGLYDVLERAFAGGAGLAAPPPPPTPWTPAAPHAVPARTTIPDGAVRSEPGSQAVQRPPGRVTSAFGWRPDPFTGASRFHRGVDIAAAYGSDVPSAGAGLVVTAGVERGYGRTVVVEHEPGVRTRYAHLSEVAVAPGERVAPGAVLGRVGRSGRATGPHVHFEVIEHGRAVDPVVTALAPSPLKEMGEAADYPTGTSRTGALPPGVEDES